jgi:hypothetical protein
MCGAFLNKKDKKLYIQMGCFTRSVQDWESDFNNNKQEFPIGSEVLKQREKAYKTIKSVALDYLVSKNKDRKK